MRFAKHPSAIALAAAALGVLVVRLAASPAPVRAAVAPARVPISFDQFHSTTEVIKYLRDVAAAYPAITELREIGRSHMGRPVYVLTISNTRTGATLERGTDGTDEAVLHAPPGAPGGQVAAAATAWHLGKPGHWIGGSTHGNEYTGTEVALAMIDRLVSGYASDPAITRLVDTKAFYICPIINPDGHFNSLEKGISQRGNSEPRDEDGDGRVNEDGPDDLDGDGVIAQFRYPDPKGMFIRDDADPRLMVRLPSTPVQPDPHAGKTRYAVVTEDRDNDGDGKRGEDPEAGIDINRNFPERWWRDDGTPGGTGTHPASSPEVRAVVEFFHAHPNLVMAQFFHTSGGFTYRPLGSAPQTRIHPRDRAILDFVMGRKYLEIVGEPVPEAWLKPDAIPALREELRKTSKNRYAIERGYEFPRAWRVSYDELADRSYGFGLSTDWDYLNFGIYSLTTELWNPELDIPGFPRIPADAGAAMARQRALLQFNDRQYGGKAFVPWKAFRHPELGEGEIGGWNPKYSSNAWPGPILKGVCDRHVEFELFRAGLMPELAITEATARVVYGGRDERAAGPGSRAAGAPAAGAPASGAGAAGAPAAGARASQGYRVLEVKAVVENTGALATHSGRGSEATANREDEAWLLADGEATLIQGTKRQRLGVIAGTMAVPGVDDAATPGESLSPAPAAAPGGIGGPPGTPTPTAVRQAGPRRTITWLVAVTGNPRLRVVISSQKGGTAVAEVNIGGADAGR